MQTVYWLVIFIVLLIIEIITMGLTTIWFALGALAAFLAGVFGFGTAVQVGVFLVVSLVLLALTRPVAVKYFNKDRTKTNAESLIGQHGLGDFVYRGVSSNNNELILQGAIPAALLALLLGGLVDLLQRHVVPRGLRKGGGDR